MKWELGIVAATVLAVAGVSRRLTGTSVTPAMMFVVIGVLVGPLVIGQLAAAPAGEGVKTLAEATLAVVLFADASRIKPRVLRREYAVPPRLLGVGLPLTMPWVRCWRRIFDQLNATEAIVLAILLATPPRRRSGTRGGDLHAAVPGRPGRRSDARVQRVVHPRPDGAGFRGYDSGRRHGRGRTVKMSAKLIAPDSTPHDPAAPTSPLAPTNACR